MLLEQYVSSEAWKDGMKDDMSRAMGPWGPWGPWGPCAVGPRDGQGPSLSLSNQRIESHRFTALFREDVCTYFNLFQLLSSYFHISLTSICLVVCGIQRNVDVTDVGRIPEHLSGKLSKIIHPIFDAD